jgi:DNA polymerase III sliding clamp (beta) subunit (PCNA family)
LSSFEVATPQEKTTKKKKAEEIGFNAGYLVDVEKVARLFNPKFCGVKFELNGNTNAAVCCLSAPSGENAKIVVMPMRL